MIPVVNSLHIENAKLNTVFTYHAILSNILKYFKP